MLSISLVSDQAEMFCGAIPKKDEQGSHNQRKSIELRDIPEHWPTSRYRFWISATADSDRVGFVLEKIYLDSKQSRELRGCITRR
jgi:hypothetical protein